MTESVENEKNQPFGPGNPYPGLRSEGTQAHLADARGKLRGSLRSPQTGIRASAFTGLKIVKFSAFSGQTKI